MNVLYLLRALGFLILQIVLSNVVLIIQLLTYPVVYFVDPNLWFYQRLVSLVATISLWPFISVRIEVREGGKLGARWRGGCAGGNQRPDEL
jgi:hypothetical protein